MAARKLQQEIEKVLKKVQEGLASFDDIMEKCNDAPNQSQREKQSEELKKEIKKLQRLRDQLRSWISGNDVKEKEPLIQGRKDIEAKMEAFKVHEKEMKTKAFSKEGLAKDNDDPLSKAKRSSRKWINKIMERLSFHVDMMEADLVDQTLSAKKSKRKAKSSDKMEELKEKVASIKRHVAALELVLRKMDNDEVTPDDVDDLKDSLDFVLESLESGDEYYEDDTLYDDVLGEGVFMNGLASPLLSGKSPSLAALDDDNVSEPPKEEPSVPKKAKAEKKAVADEPKKAEAIGGLQLPAPAMPDKKETRSRKGSKNAEESIVAKADYSILVNKRKGETGKDGKDSHEKRSSSVSSSSSSTKGKGSKHAAADEQADATPAPQPTAAQPPVLNYAALIDKQSSEPKPPSAPSSARSASADTSKPAPERPAEPQAPLPPRSAAADVVAVEQHAQAEMGAGAVRPPSVLSAPSSESDGTHPARYTSNLTASLQANLPSLESSLSNIDASASQRRPPVQRSSYTPQRPFTGPSCFPTQPFEWLENSSMFEKFDIDTLFFIFYYQQGTYQQFLAAKELKRQAWRYHTKYLTWFQRLEEPKVTTDTHEQGTYVYFDYETGWCQRIKTEFMFEYKFLEDEL